MNDLIIDNHVIKRDIKSILSKIKSQIDNGKLRNIKYGDENVAVTCPHHSDGLERNPSCNIYVGNSSRQTWGNFHCFTCNEKGSLYKFVAECFDKSEDFGKKWLKENFCDHVIEDQNFDSGKIILNNNSKKEKSSIKIDLNKFQSWHPYLAKRKLSRDICEKFNIKYDPETESIVFPVNDEKGNLIFLTRRSVNSKKFIIDADVEKPVYLLDDVIKNNNKEIYICESQINALTLRSWGYPAVALFGTGTSYQYKLLNNTDIYIYHLCFDGDSAGWSGAKRFINNIKNSSFIDVVLIPKGKDVNDLEKEEFVNLPSLDKYDFLKVLSNNLIV